MNDDRLRDYDVAVVVFARAPGVDVGDASDRARAAVRAALVDASVTIGPHGLPIVAVPRDTDNTVTIADAQELSSAFVNYLVVTPARRLYRDRGLDPLPESDDR